MQYNRTPIFQKTYILTTEIYQATAYFSKEHKYTLGERLKDKCHDMMDLIMEANAGTDKLEKLRRLDIRLENLRIYVRLAYDLKAISAGLLEKLNTRMNEIGVQIGGWQKWAAKPASPSISAGVSDTQGY